MPSSVPCALVHALFRRWCQRQAFFPCPMVWRTLCQGRMKLQPSIDCCRPISASPLAGALCLGTCPAQVLVYPLEIVKTRMAVSAPGTYSGILGCLATTVRTEGTLVGGHVGIGREGHCWGAGQVRRCVSVSRRAGRGQGQGNCRIAAV